MNTEKKKKQEHEHAVCPHGHESKIEEKLVNDAAIAHVADLPHYSDILLMFRFHSKWMTKFVSSLPPKQVAFTCTERCPCPHPLSVKEVF